ncbi:MAG: 2-oxo acid dehydrogenase subunit E2 [Pseudonocardiaceae bacterium]
MSSRALCSCVRSVATDPADQHALALASRIYLALSYDHRLVDDADAARFLHTTNSTPPRSASPRPSSRPTSAWCVISDDDIGPGQYSATDPSPDR